MWRGFPMTEDNINQAIERHAMQVSRTNSPETLLPPEMTGCHPPTTAGPKMTATKYQIAELFITESATEVGRLHGFRKNGIKFLFAYAMTQATRIHEVTPVIGTMRTAYIVFKDQSTIVAAKCRNNDNKTLPTWKIAKATQDGNGKPKPPANPEGPKWSWISSQVDAPAWTREMENLLAGATTTTA